MECLENKFLQQTAGNGAAETVRGIGWLSWDMAKNL